MEMKIAAVVGALQAGTTVRTTQTSQDARPLTTGAAQSLRDQIRQDVRAQAQAAAGAATGQAAPAAPAPPRQIVIQGRNGAETITLPSDFSAGDVIPPQAVDISVAFFLTMAVIIIGLPLARAFARRMDRKAAPAQVSNELSSQLTQLTQAVDAIALEVERISEGQRFTTRLLSEQRDAARQTLPSAVDRG